MTDAPDRPSPRFPESRVPQVRLRVQTVLEQQAQPLHGVSSAARGGDLIFLTALLELGGTATVLLPFPPDDFRGTSVGEGWDEIFDRVLRNPQVEVRPPIHPTLPASTDAQIQAFEACNDWIVNELAALSTTYQDPEPLFLSVFHQTAAQLAGGTWDAINRWRDSGHPVTIIDPLAPDA